MLYGRTFLFIHSICNILHLLIPNSHSCFPLTHASLFSKFVSLLLFCRYTHLHYILDPTYKWYMAFAFSFWLTSVSMIISRSIYVAADADISFFSTAEQYCICVYIYVPHLLYSFFCRWHSFSFHFLTTVNSAAMNIKVYVSFQIGVFSGYMPKNEIVELYGNSIFSF